MASLLASASLGRAQDVLIDAPTTFVADTTVSRLTVSPTGRLTALGQITVLGNMRVDSGGVVTHGSRQLSGLRLHVRDTLWVAAGGRLDADSLGLRGGGPGRSLFGVHGEAFDSTGAIVSGAQGGNAYGAGASYGGWGGEGVSPQHHASPYLPNAPYGVIEDVTLPGAGGGGPDSPASAGGNGGGLIRVHAGVCIVDGTIRADGGRSWYGPQTGAGSGGGIRLQVGLLAGSGQITARGGGSAGVGDAWMGAGGGGRIVVLYDTMTMPVTSLIASAGFYTGLGPTGRGSAGSIYLKASADSLANLLLDNDGIETHRGTPIRSAAPTLGELVVANQARLKLSDVPLTLLVAAFVARMHGVLEIDVDHPLETLRVEQQGFVDVNTPTRVTSRLVVTSGGLIRRP